MRKKKRRKICDRDCMWPAKPKILTYLAFTEKVWKSWFSEMRGIKVNLKLSPTGQENIEHLH